MISFRTMVSDDAFGVSLLEKECFSSPWPESELRKSLEQPYAHFFVAVNDEKVVGYIGAYQAADEYDITNIAVTKDARRQNVATQLMNMVIDKARDEGIVAVNLEVRESNDVAVSFYRKVGFERIGVRKNFYTRPTENAIIYRFILIK